MTLDPEAVARARSSLLDDGYCIVGDVLEPELVDELRRWSDEMIVGTDHPKRWRYQGSDIWVSGEVNRSRRHPELPAAEIVDRLIDRPREWLFALGLEDLRPFGYYQIISKPPGAPALYWHQDFATWSDPICLSPWPQQVFANFYLSETGPENGCLRVIPGSHKKRFDLHDRLVEAHDGGAWYVDEDHEWMFHDDPHAIDLPVRPGELVLADARMLHATRKNSSDERRTLLLGWYMRRAMDVPANWDGDIPREILERDPERAVELDRIPGDYLRP